LDGQISAGSAACSGGRALAKLLERHHDPEAHVFVEHQEGGFVLFIFLIELGRDLGDAGDVLNHLLQLFGCLGELLLDHAKAGQEGLGPVHQRVDALIERRLVAWQQQLDALCAIRLSITS
jgi:hypothetical protein